MFAGPAGGAGQLFSSPAKGFVLSGLNEVSETEVQGLVDEGIATREPLIADGGLAQSKVASLTTDLAAKASTVDLISGLSTKQPTLSASSAVAVGTLDAATINVNGGIACTELAIQGADVSTSIGSKQDVLSTLSGTGVSLLSSPTELSRIFGSDGISVSSFLNLSDTADERNFNLQVSGAALQSQISEKQDTLDSNSSVLLVSLTAVGDINSGIGSVNCAGVNTEGLTVSSATGSTNLVVQDTAGAGFASMRMNSATNSFQLLAQTGVANIRTNGEHEIRLQTARFAGLPTSTTVALTISTSNQSTFGGTVFFADGSQNASDAKLKSIPEDASTQDSINLLKEVSARTYERMDKPGTGTRVGFIAREV